MQLQCAYISDYCGLSPLCSSLISGAVLYFPSQHCQMLPVIQLQMASLIRCKCKYICFSTSDVVIEGREEEREIIYIVTVRSPATMEMDIGITQGSH